jgi:glycosyltransferase involved in cell wall biosynthesis
MKTIQIVIPVYNEEGNIAKLTESIINEIKLYNYSIILVNDGSTDDTLQKIKDIAKDNDKIKYLSFSKNFGHQFALKAGLDYSSADAVISMDGDMQHPPSIINLLIEQWEKGHEIVYTVREEDINLPFLKRLTSRIFYRLMNNISGLKLKEGMADFRLLDKKVVDEVKKFTENELFFRGLINWIGYKQIGIKYKPEARFSGKSKYTYKKMFKFALQGITSFSTKPLYISVYFGLMITAITFILYFIYLFYSFYTQSNISGWASLISTVVFFGGLNLTVLGIIGIYIGKLFMQSKNRPTYIISEKNIL